ncbi:D-mannonate oxidoreductase [Vibrio crassostreae]|uniref:D-mannonate oxidoreductase n=2 Tax=Vibrio crassostreae TaxID=246167 RepID=A0A822N4V7_9VIBR|nr:fructuronate reductase [Vibrio crassostreae]MDH5951191.1 fructuronate reductase [Vibrio crassostreae]TCN05203.1 fructuronate reductase [Vibrio crassostreae]TCT57807.1 fructuronate reductase [Vibrio crassostreae]TCT71529.1 fructuronate reductase [Vibrio crassostreae]TCT77971.1 fructuronate reductase [Vibrio crassostreae]
MKTVANSTLPNTVLRPDYDRSTLQSRIVHLGFGAFHRAHQALFTNEMLSKSNTDWGICEINLFGGEDLIESLRAQDHLYTVAEKGAESTDVKVIGSVTESLHPSLDGIETVLEKMAEPQVAIVSMTITEKGYCADPATGKLDKNNPLVIADLANPSEPKSALGYIVQALKIRRERGLTPFTVMSCDNVQENGHVAKAAIIEFAQLLDPELRDWIETNVTFPCTMVDRIVPAATEETLTEIAELLGCEDPCGIACEPFRQWVIEDNFVAGRPDWNVAGAEFVEDVVPYEEMKLRMLNGSHSFLAYLGYLGGYDHISDTMTDAGYRKAAFDMMMKSQAPSLTMPEGTDLEGYATLLINRFTNPSLKHKTWQISMDGSQKIPQRMGGSLRFHLEQGSDLSWLATAIAGWMRYVSGVDEQGNEIDVRDPMVDTLRQICDQHGLNVSVVPALLAVEAIFPVELGQNPQVIDTVSSAYQSLIEHGAVATVAAL